MKSLNPKIKYLNHLGQTQQFEKYQGKKVWLAFYRYASCPLCNLHIHSIINEFEKVKNANLIFLPVFQSSVEEVRKYAGKSELPFEIICDPEESLYRQFEVKSGLRGFLSLSVIWKIIKAMLNGHIPGKMNGNIARIPSEFVYDRHLNLILRYDGSDIGDHPTLETILNVSKD